LGEHFVAFVTEIFLVIYHLADEIFGSKHDNFNKNPTFPEFTELF
jgi:hypothetical protein